MEKVKYNKIIEKIYQKQDFFFTFLLVILAISASLFISYCTKYSFSKWGFSDSAVYFASAQNFAKGIGVGIVNPDGLFQRLTIFPPVYSFVLGLLVKTGLNIFVAARLIDVVSFGLFIFIIGLLFYKITSAPIFASAFSLMSFVNYELVINFTSLMSEPLAFLFGFSGFLLSVYFLKKKTNWILLIAGILSSLSLLTRYAFIAFPVACILIIFLFLDEKLKKKCIYIIEYVILGLGPFFVWSSIGKFNAKAIAGRTYFVDNQIIHKLINVLVEYYKICKYWLPSRSYMIFKIRSNYITPFLVAFLLLIVFLGVYFAIKNFRQSTGSNKTLIVFTASFFILSIVYIFVIIFSNTFTNMSAINSRILSPILPAIFGFLLGCLLLIKSFTNINRLILWAFCIILTFFFVKFNYPLVMNYAIKNAFENYEPTPVWVDKPIFNKIRAIGFNNSDVVFSNGPDIVLYYTAKYPYYVKSKMFEEYGSQINNTDKTIISKCQIYILFPPDFIDSLQRQEDPITKEQIYKIHSHFNVLYNNIDGIIAYNENCPQLSNSK
jgi:hypothetical protein